MQLIPEGWIYRPLRKNAQTSKAGGGPDSYKTHGLSSRARGGHRKPRLMDKEAEVHASTLCCVWLTAREWGFDEAIGMQKIDDGWRRGKFPYHESGKFAVYQTGLAAGLIGSHFPDPKPSECRRRHFIMQSMYADVATRSLTRLIGIADSGSLPHKGLTTSGAICAERVAMAYTGRAWCCCFSFSRHSGFPLLACRHWLALAPTSRRKSRHSQGTGVPT